MAKKIQPPPKPQPKDDGSNDLEILHPDRSMRIAGRDITVREYGFIEGLRVRTRAKPLTDALRAQIVTGSALLEDIRDVLAAQWELVRELLAQSVGVEPEWIDGLGEADGQLLLLTWWGVCGPFFVGMIARRISQDIHLKAARAGQASMPFSLPPALGIPISSGAIPSVS